MRRIGSGKRTIGSSNSGGTRTLCTSGIKPHRQRRVGCPLIRPSSPPGSIELHHSKQVHEFDVFSPATANFPCAPWNRAGVAQSSIGLHEPNIESPPPTPIKIATAESCRWRTTRGCGAHRSAAFGVGGTAALAPGCVAARNPCFLDRHRVGGGIEWCETQTGEGLWVI
jgi:hypothetical protein